MGKRAMWNEAPILQERAISVQTTNVWKRAIGFFDPPMAKKRAIKKKSPIVCKRAKT